MIRYLILFFNMLGLLVYHLFLPDVITATQVVPSSVKPGDSFTVEVTINKGTVSSFAKLQEDLPNGFTASEVDSKGGSFSFKDHSVKFIWTALPSDNSFVVKYKITVDPSANGQQSFGGKFSYVIDNNRQSVEIASSSITVGNNNQPVAATSTDNSTNQTASTTATSTDNSTNQTASTTPTSTDNSTNQTASTTPTSTDNSTNQTASTTPASTDNSTNQTASTTPASTDNSTNQTASTTPTSTDNTTNTQSSTTNNSDGVSAVRIVPSGNISGSFTVSVTINRSNVSGFAKFEDDLPIGFTATAIDKDGASFSFADQKVKFIWLSLPNDAVIKVSYNVTVDNTISGNQTITGLFAYVKDSTRKVMLAPSTVNISSGSNQPMASNNGSVNSSTPNTTNSNSVQPNNTINSSGSNQVANNSSTTNNTSTTSGNQNTTTNNSASNANNTNTAANDATAVANIPSGKSGVSYSVQIAALHKPVQTSYFVKNDNINEKIRLEMMDGFTKYVVGHFTEYKSARDHREVVRAKGIVGPFVTAYNTGKRITVQEALMISNQKWYK